MLNPFVIHTFFYFLNIFPVVTKLKALVHAS